MNSEEDYQSRGGITGAEELNDSFFLWSDNMTMKWALQDETGTIFDRPVVRALAISVYTFIFIICFIGNLAVVLVTAFHADMKVATKRYYLYLGHLAFANFCVGIFCIFPNLMMYLHYSWMLGDSGCKMYHFITSLFESASVLILLVFSIESYLAIVQPCTCIGRISGRQLKMILFGVWLLSLLVSSPKLYYYKVLDIPDVLAGRGKVRLMCIPVHDLFSSVTVETLQFIFMFLLPFVAISCLHTRIRRAVQESCRHDHRRVDFVNSNLSHSSERKVSESTHQYPHLQQQFGEEEVIPTPSKSVRGQGPSLGDVEQSTYYHGLRNEISQVAHGRKGSSKSKRTSNPRPWCSSPKDICRKSTKLSKKSHLMSMTCLSRVSVTPETNSDRRDCNGKSNGLAVKGVQHPQKNLVRMLAIAATTFVVCNLPFHIRKLYQNLFDSHGGLQQGAAQLLPPLTFLCSYTNCALNPLIFGFMSKRFRTCFQEIIRCRCQRQSQPDFYL